MCTRWGHQGATEGSAPAATEAQEGRFRPRRPFPRWLMQPQSHGAVQEGAAKDRRRHVTDSAEPCAHTTAYCADPESRPGAALGFGGSSEDRGETAGLGLGLAELKLRGGIRAWGGAGARGGGPLPARLHLQGLWDSVIQAHLQVGLSPRCGHRYLPWLPEPPHHCRQPSLVF